jgi:hypothetical protein
VITASLVCSFSLYRNACGASHQSGPMGGRFLAIRALERMKRKCEETIMEDQRPTIPHQLSSSQVLWRFVLRLLLLSTFATFSTQSFGTTLAALLTLSATFCAVLGAMRREAMFGPVLTHWDEAAAYAVIGRLVSAVF